MGVEKARAVIGQPAKLYTYKGDDHDIENNFGTAMTRTIQFFDQYLKM